MSLQLTSGSGKLTYFEAALRLNQEAVSYTHLSSSEAPSGPDGNVPYALPESAKVDDSYFDDAVFIGDSVSLKLERYTTQQRSANPNFFGKAQFLTAGSMGSGNALEAPSSESIHPLYNGQKMALADSVKACGAKKVYIMLGMNDMAIYGVCLLYTSFRLCKFCGMRLRICIFTERMFSMPSISPGKKQPVTPGEVRPILLSLAEEKYKNFSASLLPGVGSILGVRLPLLRKLAGRILKSDWEGFLRETKGEYFEETMLKGFVLAQCPISPEERILRLKEFLPEIQNWSVCDSVCASVKDVYKRQYWPIPAGQ